MKCRGARDVIGNEHSDLSLNPGLGYLHFT